MGILDDAIREHLELKRAHGAPDDEIKRKEVEAFGPVRHDAAPVVTAEPEATVTAEPPVEDDHDSLQPAPEDPYEVHADGDHAQPDPGFHEPTEARDLEASFDFNTAADAGAGTLEPSSADPGPPAAAEHHHDEQHPALVDHDHIQREEQAPEPVFKRTAAESPNAPEAPVAPEPDAPLQPAPEDPYVGDPPVEHPDIDEPPPRQSPEQGADHELTEPHPPSDDVLEETPEFLQDAPEHDRLWFEQKPPRDFDFGE